MIVRNRKEWMRWIRKEFSQKHERKCWYRQPPKEFPVYCATTALSYGMEEDQPLYIYREDVRNMFPELTQQEETKKEGR